MSITNLIAALKKDGTDLVAMLGGSRERQNAVTAGNQLRTMASGPLIWAKLLGRRFETTVFQTTGPMVNSQGMAGMLFANDGEGAWASYKRLPALIASDAKIVIIPMSSNSVQYNNFDIFGLNLGTTFSAANYVSLYQQIATELIDAGKVVIMSDLIERGVYLGNGTTEVGGVWQSGSQPRSQISLINSTMRAWCDQNDIPYIATHEMLTEEQQNGSNTDIVPKAAYVRYDSTHYSAEGGFAIGQKYDELFEQLGFTQRPIDSTATGNYFPNPTFANAGGSVESGFASGSVAPAGLTISRDGQEASVTSRMVSQGGKQWLEFEVDASTLTTGQESILAYISLPSTPADVWLNGQCQFEIEMIDGELRGQPNMFMSAGSFSTWGMIPIDNGGSGVTSATSMSMTRGPSTDYTGTVESMPVNATSSGCSIYLRSPSFRSGAKFKFRVTDIEVRQVTDPHLLMYAEADTTPPQLTTSAALEAAENETFVTRMYADKPVRWSVDGPDAALFAYSETGRLRLKNDADFEAPNDADLDGVYSLDITLTGFNPNVQPTVVPMTITVTDKADGTVYDFNGADNTDLVDFYDGVTRLNGVSGGLYLLSNRARNNPNAAESVYLFPEEATDGNTEVRWQLTSSSPTVRVCLKIQDANNYVFMDVSSGQMRVVSKLNGEFTWHAFGKTDGLSGNGFDGHSAPSGRGLYKSLSNGQTFVAQWLNGNINVYQDSVHVMTVPAENILPDVRASGLATNSTSGSWNTIDAFNVRPAEPFQAKVILSALTLTEQTNAANANYGGVVSGYSGTPDQMSVAVDVSGLFYMDGYNLRSTSPLTAGETYSVTVAESNDNAVASPRTTVFTIIGSDQIIEQPDPEPEPEPEPEPTDPDPTDPTDPDPTDPGDSEDPGTDPGDDNGNDNGSTVPAIILDPSKFAADRVIDLAAASPAATYQFDPSDIVPFAANVSGLLEDGEQIGDIENCRFAIDAEGLSAGLRLAINERQPHLNADNDTFVFWLLCDEAQADDVIFNKGYSFAVKITFSTTSTPAKTYQRTIKMRAIQR